MPVECLECGHDEAQHSNGPPPMWPCLVPGCKCPDVVYKRPDEVAEERGKISASEYDDDPFVSDSYLRYHEPPADRQPVG